MLTLDKVFDASNVLKEVIRPTACIHAPKVNPDCDVYLKTENLQVTGSFKVREELIIRYHSFQTRKSHTALSPAQQETTHRALLSPQQRTV